jgi:ABC-type lipoprotein release transport system permease subunit
MLIIDKRDDIRTLHNLGASNKDISWIFMIEGWMISISGVLIGIVLGVVLCLIQQEFGVLKFGSSAGSYIVDTYPVRLLVSDIVLVFFTVVVIGLLSVWFPVRHFSKQQIKRVEN